MGRGKNGMAFFYNSDIVLSNPIQYYGNRIGVMELESVVIIGVYFCYNDGSEATRQELETDLVTIRELIDLFKNKNKESVVVGDLNVDFTRMNKFTTTLIDMMVNTDYIAAEIEYGHQAIDYTWHSIRYDKENDNKPYLITTWVDHLLVKRKSTLVPYVEIIKSDENRGDHNCIRFILQQESKNDADELVKTQFVKMKPFKPSLDWRNKEAVTEYSDKVQKEMLKLDFEFKSLSSLRSDSDQMENKLTSALNAIHDAMVYAKSRLINLYAYTNRPKRKYGIRSKDWWCETLQHYMEQMRYHYKMYKDSGYDPKLKTAYTEAKRLFRCRKRYNILLKRNKNIRKLDDLFQLNREDFWRRIKTSQLVKQTIDMPLDEAKSQYEELFNVSFPHNVDKEKIKIELNQMLNEPEEDDEITIVEQSVVEEIIRSLKNGKSTGYHGISNEMVKYALSKENDLIAKNYTIIFNKIIESSVVPKDFNISIIKPLVKDPKKPSDNKSNLRPVAVSNVSDVIFEKVVAKKVRKQCKTSDKQFGFKSHIYGISYYLYIHINTYIIIGGSCML